MIAIQRNTENESVLTKYSPVNNEQKDSQSYEATTDFPPRNDV